MLKYWITVIALLLVGACGYTLAGREQTSRAALVGKWTSNCHASELLSSFAKSYYQFSKTEVAETYELHLGPRCRSAVAQIRLFGTFDVPRGNASVAGSRDMDLNINRVEAVALTADGQTLLSGINFCGQAVWVISQPIDVTSSSTSNDCPISKTGKYYDIYKVNSHLLKFGQGEFFQRSIDPDHLPPALGEDRIYYRD